MKTPDQNSWPAVCTLPARPDQLRDGYPGVEQVNLGAIYADIGGALTRYKYGDPAVMTNIANWAISSPGVVDPARGDQWLGGQGIQHKLRNGIRIHYSLYQYKNIDQTHLIPSYSTNGMVCSTFMAYAHAYGGAGIVPPREYGHPQIALAANRLAGAVN